MIRASGTLYTRGVATSSTSARPGPTDPTSPSSPNGPPETVKNITATSGPSRSPPPARGGRVKCLYASVPLWIMIVPGAPDHGRVVAGERLDVDHPPEDPRQEPPAHRGARRRVGDGRPGPEHRPTGARFPPALPLAARRHAPVHVLVPVGDAEGDPPVQLVLGGPRPVRVHRPDQLEAAVALPPVQQRGRLRRVESEALSQRVQPVGGVVDPLPHAGQELPETV